MYRRKDSTLTDDADRNVSLTKGYYDARNYLKSNVPLPHTVTVLAWDDIEWFESYRRANLAHPEPNVLFFQVGNDDIDNSYWESDTWVPLPRPSYMVNSSAPGTDATALTAAALSPASYLFKDQINDTEYANLLLSHAVSLFNFAEMARPWTPYSQSVPAAVGNNTYLEKANGYYYLFSKDPFYGISDWSDHTGVALILGATLDQVNVCNYTYGDLFYSQMNHAYPNLSLNYTDFIQNQMSYILEANQMHAPYESAYMLHGAAVGGPDYYDNFYDIRSDYKQTEVALDYNAPFQSLIAYQISINAIDPSYVNTTQDRPDILSKEPALKGWEVVIIVVVIVVVLVALAIGFWWYKKKKRSKEMV
ncbi:Six-hairpin glycosidase-like protein [Gilbertella persicaria]|uniref:Six-hairpin glycosidase-like protein n=1 Tax=Gilbertella persicaria TaxID=101096 RepID=UPI00221F3317|nr:Six-hairpin glycosidase-like protein [Gilbertella persicaria]KAI8097998.1 Six-hairpin glycosidase-like protein [Gilbertella persicaria]